MAELVVGHPRSGPEPHVPVETRRGLGVRFPARGRGATDAHLHVADLADAAAANQGDGLLELAAGALLAAGLKDARIAPDHLDELLGLLDGEGQRLLAVDVLPGPAGVHAGERVPVVGGRDADGVDVIPGEQLAVVVVAHATIADALLGRFPPVCVDITHGQDLGLIVPDEAAEMSAAHAADPDEAHRDPLVSGVLAVLPESAGADHIRHRHSAQTRGGCLAQELASVRSSTHHDTSKGWGHSVKLVSSGRGGDSLFPARGPDLQVGPAPFSLDHRTHQRRRVDCAGASVEAPQRLLCLLPCL